MENKITKFLAGRDEKFVEEGANLEHERWASWQKHVFSKCKSVDCCNPEATDKSLIIPHEFVERWMRQINTPYSELSEEDKEKDREQVRPYLPMTHQTSKQLLELIVEMVGDSIREDKRGLGRAWVIPYNQALTDIKSKLEEALSDIK